MTTMVRTAAAVAPAAARAVGRFAWPHSDARTGHRWLGVTVYRPPTEIDPNALPEPLRRLGDTIEVRIKPAPGDKGTELYARPRQAPLPGPAAFAARLAGSDPRQPVRRALREAKSILEVGYVLMPDAPPTTHPGPAGKLVQMATRIADSEGVL